jgi:hypothetical protein
VALTVAAADGEEEGKALALPAAVGGADAGGRGLPVPAGDVLEGGGEELEGGGEELEGGGEELEGGGEELEGGGLVTEGGVALAEAAGGTPQDAQGVGLPAGTAVDCGSPIEVAPALVLKEGEGPGD